MLGILAYGMSQYATRNAGVDEYNYRLVVTMAFLIISLGLSFFITSRAYSRYCLSLFSFVFVLSKSDRSSLQFHYKMK